MSETQGFNDPRCSTGIAREDLGASVPVARVAERGGVDVPDASASEPADVDRPEDTVRITNIEHVRVAVSEKNTILPPALELEKLPELGEGSLHPGLIPTQFGEDGYVARRLTKLVVEKFHFSGGILDLTEEMLPKIVSHPTDPDESVLSRVDDEVVLGDEIACRRNRHGVDELQEFVGDRLDGLND